MRCTGEPQRGQASLYLPWTAISARNAVTRVGHPSPTWWRRRSVHLVREVTVALWSRSISVSSSCLVRATGESCASHRISSEKAFPMPEKTWGSVSARFRVRFCAVRTAANSALDTSSGSTPPRSSLRTASSESNTHIPARFLVPCSVRMRVPSSKSQAASPTFLGMAAPFPSFHCSRPATMRWMTTNSSPSSRCHTIRFPIRDRPVTVAPTMLS